MLIRPGLDQLKPYSVDETEFPIRLDANERATNLPAAVLQETITRLSELAFNRYPDIGIVGIRDKIAKAMNLSRESVVIGNGSSELLAALCYTFGGAGRSIVFPTPSFSMYGIYTKLADSQAVPVQLKADYSLSADEVLAAAAASSASLILLCNPNNPTGNAIPMETIEAIVAGAACPVVVDEAYYEFHGHSSIGLLSKYSNLIITRTFSKAYGLASARVGYLLADPQITTILGKALMPYHVNALSLAAAEVVYDRRKAFEPDIDLAIRERQRLIDSLSLIEGLEVYPSQANFVLIKATGKGLAQWLAANGIGVRDFGSAPGLEGCMRITIGTVEENNTLLQAVAAYIQQVKV